MSAKNRQKNPSFILHLCFMTDRGSIAQTALTKSGLSKKYVSERLNIDPKTLYNKLQRRDLEYDFIIELYKVIKMDVTEDFPELGKYVLNEEEVPGALKEYQAAKSALDSSREEIEKWKNKYIQLLEEYSQVLKENKDLQAKLGEQSFKQHNIQ